MSRGYLKKCSTGTRPKERLASEAEAEKRRWSMPGAHRRNTYECGVCGFWHVGSLGSAPRGKDRTPRKRARRLDCQ